MDELEREVKIYGEVNQIINEMKNIKVALGSAEAATLTRAVNSLSFMRDELRRSDLEIKDLKAGVK